MGTVTFNSSLGSDLIENENEYQKLKKELDDLETKFQELNQEIHQILSELIAMTTSGSPPSPKELAEIMGKLDTITNEVNQVVSQEKSLETQIGYLAVHTLGQHLSPTDQNLVLLQNLVHQLQQEEKQLGTKDQREEELQKKLINTLHSIMQTFGSRNSESATQLQQLVTILNQLSSLTAELRDKREK